MLVDTSKSPDNIRSNSHVVLVTCELRDVNTQSMLGEHENKTILSKTPNHGSKGKSVISSRG